MKKIILAAATVFALAMPMAQADAHPICAPVAAGVTLSSIPFDVATGLGFAAMVAIATDQPFPLCSNPKAGSHAGPGILPVATCDYTYTSYSGDPWGARLGQGK